MSILYYKNLIVKSFAIVSFFALCTAFADNKQVLVPAPTNYLFLQNAQSGVLKSTPTQGIYQLTLQGLQPYVTYFSDRPNRITGLMTIDTFLKEWQGNVKSGIKTVAPNVGIEGIKLHAFSRNQEVSFIMVLSNPIYDKKSNTMTYTAHPLKAQGTTNKDNIELHDIALFIDDFGSCPSCCCGIN